MTPFAACALAFLIQDPGEILARYQLQGKQAVVTRSDVAVEMAFHLRRRDQGRQAVEILVASAITRSEAERLKLMPTDAEVRKFWTELQRQLRDAGNDPTQFAAVRNSTEAEWLTDLATQLAQQNLVRHALGLAKGEAVGGDMLRLWMSERRKQATIVTDPDHLALGTAARVDGRDIPIFELGLLLLRKSEDHERDQFIRQVVYLNSIEALAREHGIELDQVELDAAIEQRRQEALRLPRYRGLTFEQLLETQGLTIASLKRSRVFRAKVLQDRLTAQLQPRPALLAEIAADRDAVAARVGARRHLGVIYRRALDEPNALVPHDFASAEKSLLRVKQRLDIERFDVVARIETDDPRGKELGGDTGWHHRLSADLPKVVIDAAFAGDSDAVLGPIRAEDGCYLVRVFAVEPEPDDDTLIERLRTSHADELAEKILTDAKIELVTDKTAKDNQR